MTLRLIFYHYFVSFSLFSLSLSVVSIKYIHKKNNKIINAEKFCSNKCSLYKPTMGKIEGVFLLCFLRKRLSAAQAGLCRNLKTDVIKLNTSLYLKGLDSVCSKNQCMG